MSNEIAFKILGGEEYEGYSKLNDFVSFLSNINTILNGLDKRISRQGSPTLEHRIVKLHLGSPDVIGSIRLIPKDPIVNHSEAVVYHFNQSWKELSEGKIPAHLGEDIINPFLKMKKKISDNGKDVVIISDKEYSLKSDVSPTLEIIEKEDIIEFGTVSGVLEKLNIHAGKNEFHIFPVVGAKQIKCKFSNDLIPQAIGNVGRYMELRGKVHYRIKDDFPYFINVKEMEVYEREEKLKSYYELKGKMKLRNENKSSEDLIAELRNEQ